MAQQAGGVDEIKARSAKDAAFLATYANEPGGTREENLWEVLVLMGVGDPSPPRGTAASRFRRAKSSSSTAIASNPRTAFFRRAAGGSTTKIENVMERLAH